MPSKFVTESAEAASIEYLQLLLNTVYKAWRTCVAWWCALERYSSNILRGSIAQVRVSWCVN